MDERAWLMGTSVLEGQLIPLRDAVRRIIMPLLPNYRIHICMYCKSVEIRKYELSSLNYDFSEPDGIPP